MKGATGGHNPLVTVALLMPADVSPGQSRAAEGRLRAIVREHVDFTWRSLRRLGLPADVADDATQRVFLVVSAKLDSIEPGRERAFLFNTALRIASSEKRSFARRRERPDEDAVDRARDSAPATDEQLDRHRARQVLEELLLELEMDLRAVFVLFELEELSTLEIAATLELPPGTVSSRLRRARDEFAAATKRYHARARSRAARRGRP
jgi:RNA polymerase sigma-70 factor, ECF subfamily